MSFLAAVEREVEARNAAMARTLRVFILFSPQDLLDIKLRRHHRSARKRRTVNKWRNAILKRFDGEWW